MNTRRWMVVAVAIALCGFGSVRAGEIEDHAVNIAEDWLVLVDAGDYGESWEETSTLSRDVVTKDQWQRSLDGALKPLGKMISRKLKLAEYATALPGAPDGEYVVIQFETTFEHKKSAIETVVPMKDKDGVWRVSGYFIK